MKNHNAEIEQTETGSVQVIRAAYAEALSLADLARGRTKVAVEKAAAVGALLITEKSRVEAIHGKGCWSTYVVEILGIPESTARGWMKLGSAVIFNEGEIDQNAIRQGSLALELFPAKVHQPVPGDVILKKPVSHLWIVNKLMALKRDFDRSKRKLNQREVEQMRADFLPAITWLRSVGVI